MNIVQRVQNILLKPKDTWPAIEQEPGDTASIYKTYVLPLAAIPAVAGFIGLTLLGVGAFGVTLRVPLMTGLVNMVVSFVLSLVMVYVLALIVNALAPNFGATKNQLNAFKLVAYASTAGFIGGIFSLLPALAMLGLLAALYSIYLVYTGLPVLMKNPDDKSVAYTAVIVVCGIVAGVIMGALTALVSPGAPGMRLSDSGGDAVSIKVPGGPEIAINTANMQAMAKKMEQAQASGNTADATKAAADMMGAVTAAMSGGTGVPIATAELKAYMPAQLDGFKRESIEAQSSAAMGIASASVAGVYVKDEQRIRLNITDMGGLGGLASIAGWASATLDREDATSAEKVYRQGKRTLHEEFQKDGSRSEFTIVLANGLLVSAEGEKVDIASLKTVIAGLDLAKLESTQRPAKS